MRRDRRGIGPLDYALMGVGSSLAAYSAGLSIDEQDIAWFYVRWILIGTLFSWGVRSFANKSWFVKADSFLYPVGIAAAVIFGRELTDLLPHLGFPLQLLAASWLGWMLVIGSFATWRDSTLLFQAIPAIALFGLVGCYDTFRDVTFAFFGFLICLATLFARAHGRDMLRQAADSGFFGSPETGGITDPGEQQEKIIAGPWKWVAGPEWALASALVIVLLSLLGAPVIQQSVKGVAGVVRVNQPVPRPSNPGTLTNTQGDPETVQVGRGPNTTLTDTQLYAIGGLTSEYWRTSIFDTYNGRGWQSTIRANADPTWSSYAIDQISHPKELKFTIEPLRPSKPLPVPGEVLSWDDPGVTSQKFPGVWEVVTDRQNTLYSGTVMLNADEQLQKNAVRNLPTFLQPYLSTSNITRDVQQFAEKVSASGKTDFEKATLIRDAIARQVKYNLLADAVPADTDPVSYFLFTGKEGYCDLFASSMTVMARSIGIPARYVQGYLPSATNEDPRGRVLILDRDYHAWSELYFENVGWVVFDATMGAQQVEGGERGRSVSRKLWHKTAWFQWVLDGLIMLGVGAFLWFGTRSITFSKREPNPRDRVVELYSRFASDMDRVTAKRRAISLTPDEHLALSLPSLGDAAAEAERITSKFVSWLYGPTLPTDAEFEQLSRDIKAWRKSIKK